jgi:hypothetical protein
VLLAVVLIAVIAASMLFTPTLRPVYGDEISNAHRQALRGLYPENERLLGLFSMAMLSVEEVPFYG